MSREFYDLRNGGPANRALPVMIRCILHLDEQARASTSHILDVGATAEVTTARFRCLDEDHDQTLKIINFLQEEVTTTRDEVREFRDRHAVMEQRVIEAER